MSKWMSATKTKKGVKSKNQSNKRQEGVESYDPLYPEGSGHNKRERGVECEILIIIISVIASLYLD